MAKTSEKKPSKKRPAKKKPADRLKMPKLQGKLKSKSKKSIPARRKAVTKHIKSLYGTAFCPALGEMVAFNKNTSLLEVRAHAVGDRDSFQMVLNIEQLLATAKKIDEQDPKPDDAQQKPFCKMYILTKEVYRKGIARIIIGKYENPSDYQAPNCFYCVTRWNYRLNGKRKRAK